MTHLPLHLTLFVWFLQEQCLLQPPTLQLLNGMGPLGRRASDGGANIQLHAQLLKRPRGPSPLVASPVRIWISPCVYYYIGPHYNPRSVNWYSAPPSAPHPRCRTCGWRRFGWRTRPRGGTEVIRNGYKQRENSAEVLSEMESLEE